MNRPPRTARDRRAPRHARVALSDALGAFLLFFIFFAIYCLI